MSETYIKSISPMDDLEIGKVFDWVEDVKLIVEVNGTCNNCYFNFCMGRCRHFVCSGNERKDKTDVIFKRIF